MRRPEALKADFTVSAFGMICCYAVARRAKFNVKPNHPHVTYEMQCQASMFAATQDSSWEASDGATSQERPMALYFGPERYP